MNDNDLQNITVESEESSLIHFTLTNNGTDLPKTELNDTKEHTIEELHFSDYDKEEESEELIQKHTCGKCYKSFRRLSEFKKHFVLCQFDSDYHLRKEEILKNIETIEKDAVNMKNSGLCFCCGCKQNFSAKESLKRHMKLHNDEKPYTCAECSQYFATKDALKQHIKRHSSEKPYTCNECNQCFATKKSLNCHMKRHTSKTSYVCNECGITFFDVIQFRIHNRTHLCPFACDQCEEKFKTIKQLELHTSTHLSKSSHEKEVQKHKFKCLQCQDTYATEEDLKNHNKVGVHTPKYTSSYFEDIKNGGIDCTFYNKEMNLRSDPSATNHSNENSIDNITTDNKKMIFPVKYTEPKLIQNGVPEEQSIKDERLEITTKQFLLKNELCTTVENGIIKIEPKTNVTESLDDIIAIDQTSVIGGTAVKQLIENKEPETSTEQLLLNNEVYTIITLENEYTNIEQKTTVPESVVGITTQNRKPVEAGIVVEQFVEDDVPEITTQQLLENELDSAYSAQETESIKMESKDTVPQDLVNVKINDRIWIARQWIKDEPNEMSLKQLLKNEECTAVMLENKREKLESETIVPKTAVDTITDDRDSSNGVVALLPHIKTEVAETNTEELLQSELYSVITLENESIKLEPNTSILENLSGVSLIEDRVLTSEFTNDEAHTKEIKEYTCYLKEKEEQHKSHKKLNVSKILKRPRSTHKREGPFTCDFCKKKFPVLSVLENHRRSHTGEKPYICTECKQCFAHKQALNHHMTRHTGEKPYTCTTCNKSFAVKESLKRHLKVHTGEKPYACTECNQCFAIKEALNLHMRRHTGEKPFKCSECNQCFSRKQALSAHMMRHTGEKPYMCNECKHCFARKQGLELHMKRHSGEKPYICTECNQCFAIKESLNRHMKLHTGEKPFTCTECSRSFAFKLALKRHIRRHTGEKPHTCTECNKSFGVKQELKRHMRQHTGEKPYKCTECGESFNIKDSLNRHINRHTGAKPHTCTECNKSFAVKESLKRHMKLHTGEKPYTCTECNNSFAVKQALNRHMRQHTGVKPYKCTECDQCFNVNDSLKRHMKRHVEEALQRQLMQSKFFT